MEYERIERSGTMTDQRDKVEKHLKEIKSAMEKQHANLYEDDMLDLSVEMEVMTSSCKQDGLLTDADFVIQNGENKTISPCEGENRAGDRPVFVAYA